jgi:hypothetical protein
MDTPCRMSQGSTADAVPLACIGEPSRSTLRCPSVLSIFLHYQITTFTTQYLLAAIQATLSFIELRKGRESIRLP